MMLLPTHWVNIVQYNLWPQMGPSEGLRSSQNTVRTLSTPFPILSTVFISLSRDCLSQVIKCSANQKKTFRFRSLRTKSDTIEFEIRIIVKTWQARYGKIKCFNLTPHPGGGVQGAGRSLLFLLIVQRRQWFIRSEIAFKQNVDI